MEKSQMESKRLFPRSPHRSGIVIVFPAGVRSLFNPHVHRLVRAVGHQLDGVFVTYALSGGPVPDIDAALKAARFAGCDSAVVIHSDDWFSGNGWNEAAADTLWAEPQRPDTLRDDVERVVAAYNQARAASGIAA
jgi:hypothetical protein